MIFRGENMLKSNYMVLAVLCFLLALCTGCGQSDEDDDSDSENDDEDNESNFSDEDTVFLDINNQSPALNSEVNVTYDYIILEGEPAPPNPITGAETPDKYNKIPMFRFRQETDSEPRAVQSILILLPGYVAGATDFLFLAPDLIKMANGDLEVWAPDRRTHLLEDQTGMNAAEAAKNPWLAYDYYFDHLPIDGNFFEGTISPYSAETDMMSEWGIDLYMKDIRRIVQLVPEKNRATNVFIGGHSRGVGYAQLYVAYQFEDGMIGADELAGMVMVDGGRDFDPLITKNSYLRRVEMIRDGSYARHSNILSFNKDITYYLQFLAMAATKGFGDVNDPQMGPDGILQDRWLFELILPIITRFHNVQLTNEAFVGLLLDNDSGFMLHHQAHFGKMAGGAIEYDELGAYPAENGATYYWINYDKCYPQEYADIQKMARMIYEGPADFGDLYFASRFDWDEWCAGPLETEGTWRHEYFRFYTSLVDIPIIAIEGNLLEGTFAYELYRSQLPPVYGSTLPRTEFGFDIIRVHQYEHIDTVLVEADRNVFYPNIIEWLETWSEGKVQIPMLD